MRIATRTRSRSASLFAVFFAAFMAALLGLPASAQTAADCPPQAQARLPEGTDADLHSTRDRGFLWRIDKHGRTSWLYGTLHIAKPAWGPLGPVLRDALAQSDTLALELDLLDPALQRRMVQALVAQPKTPLPAALQTRLARRIEADCLPPDALAALAPEMQVAVLGSMVGRRDGLDPAHGIDTVLAGLGRAGGLAVVSLETPELQLATLQAPSAAATLALVEASLDDLESGKALATLRRIAAIWVDGDLAALARYEAWCECVKTAADRAAMARLLDDRNPALADQVADLHDSGQRVFAAVGSLHMIGPTGLPALMAQRGYRVERIEFRPDTRETSP